MYVIGVKIPADVLCQSPHIQEGGRKNLVWQLVNGSERKGTVKELCHK